MVPKTGAIFLWVETEQKGFPLCHLGRACSAVLDEAAFFTLKNSAAQAKKHPGRIKPEFVDEWIKRSDGSLVSSQQEAEAYCLRRNAQIQEMLLSLVGETIASSGSDLVGISREVAALNSSPKSELTWG